MSTSTRKRQAYEPVATSPPPRYFCVLGNQRANRLTLMIAQQPSMEASQSTPKKELIATEALLFFNIVKNIRSKADIDWEGVAADQGLKSAKCCPGPVWPNQAQAWHLVRR